MPQKSASRRTKHAESDSSKKQKLPALPTEFIVRPHPATTKLRDTANIYVSPELLKITEWKAGNFVRITKALTGIVGVVSPWSQEDEPKYALNVILISPLYLKSAGIVLGDRVNLTKQSAQPDYAKNVKVEYTDTEEKARKQVEDLGLIYEGLTTDNVRITAIDTDITTKMNELSLQSMPKSALKPYLYHPRTTELEFVKKTSIPTVQPKFSFEDIGGLKTVISTLKKNIFLPLNCPEIFHEFGIQPPRGILLYGPSGTGKTMLMRALAYESSNCHIIRINGPSIVSKYLGGTEERLRGFFQEAAKYSPAIILIDELDSLVPTRNSDDTTEVDSRVIATMLSLLDSLDGPIVVVGATSRLSSVDVSLRRPGRFDQELEVPIPDAAGRYDILMKQINKMSDRSNLDEEQVNTIASKTHGYVGADLLSLVREAVMKCIAREVGSLDDSMLEKTNFEFLKDVKLTYEDLASAMQDVRPSAMREIILEMPKVRWSDIGGQKVLKRKLREMVQLPLTASKAFKRLGINAPKGLLLYGPPGCSKTMTAKALATESGLNFLAIKGPEIFNKYVGESERKIREIFRKARLSAPSIIFIDEIDALATSRDSSNVNNVSQQVLNTLLNEIDGVEELKGVIIIGATNRPDTIDPALLRPGRLDRHVYVSPPDEEARLQIFEKNTEKFELQDKDQLLHKLVVMSDGFSGSECVLLCQEAGLNAIMSDKNCKTVTEQNFQAVIGDISKNITPEMLEYFKSFALKYKACAA